jgi:hypothetical protein
LSVEGIDFGTTNSSVALVAADSKVELASFIRPESYGAMTTHTFIYTSLAEMARYPVRVHSLDAKLGLMSHRFRMTVMPITEIIDEIDAYLSCLRQARELLLDRSTEAPQKRVYRRKRKATPKQADQAPSRSRRTNKNKSQSNPPVAHLKRRAKREVALPVPSHVTHPASHLGQPPVAPPEPTIPQSVAIKRLPSKGSRTSIRSVRHRASKSNAVTKADDPKPAIALAAPRGAKIVVVPAEQVRRERERAAQPESRRPRVPASGLTGRLAFEALFK